MTGLASGIGNDMPRARQPTDRHLCLRATAPAARCDDKAHRGPRSIRDGMDFRRRAAA